MECMMVLASARQTFGIILIIFMVICLIGLPVIATKIATPKSVKNRLKQKKKCTVKTQGRVLEVYGDAPPEFRQNLDALGRWGDRTIVYYEYFVNGVRYTGCDEIFSSLATIGGTINILYDHINPSISCTPYGRKVDNGTNYVIPMLIVAVIVLLVVLACMI